MVKKSKLQAALDAHVGKDYQHEKQKKYQKLAAKRKKKLNPQHQTDIGDIGGMEINGSIPQPEAESDGWEGDESEDANIAIDMSHIDDSDSDSGDSLANIKESHDFSGSSEHEDKVEGNDGVEEEHGIALSDIDGLSDEEAADIVPHQRLTINNKAALLKSLKSISLPISKLPFSDHQTISSSERITISDVNDDLNRELAFYKQSLDAVNKARVLLKKEGVPFSRPTDYFAEMVKSDEHMEKIKQKMTDEASNKKAAAEARRQRDLKKFGKQVQVAKLQERDKNKRATLDKINLLKRSARFSFRWIHMTDVRTERRNTDTVTAQEEDLFDVALEDAGKGENSSRSAGGRSQNKRQKKDDKFGYGGKKRFSKSGDAASSADLRGFSTKKMKGQRQASQRLGKSRRAKKS